MSGIFLSYSRADRAMAEQVIKGLRAIGVEVWWDEDMPGVDWQEELGRQISELAAVVVLWTPTSSNSKNVKDEARLGQHQEKLVNALYGVPAPPFPYDRSNGLPLDGWNGRDSHTGWTRVVRTIEDRLVEAGVVQRGEVTNALARREQEVRSRRQELADAEDAYRNAQADQEAAVAAVSVADQSFKAAEEQDRRVADMQGSSALRRAAQAELSTALAAKEDSETRRRATAATLADVSRRMTRARSELERLFEETAAGALPAASMPSGGLPEPRTIPAPGLETQQPLPPVGTSVLPPPYPSNPMPIGFPSSDQASQPRIPLPPAPQPVQPFLPLGPSSMTPQPAPAPSSSNTAMLIVAGGVFTLLAVAVLLLVFLHPKPATNGLANGLAQVNTANTVPTIASADPVGDGITAYNNKDYGRAMALLTPPATAGNGQAANYVGFMYEQGYGVTQNYPLAMTWFQKGAAAGNDVAQYNIGLMYANNWGVPTDYSQAMVWLQKSADQGYASAQSEIGYFYEHGKGVAQDYDLALVWYQKAAAQNDAFAENGIGNLYYSGGQNVPHDYSQALGWYQKAADQGNADAEDTLGEIYENGYGVSADPFLARQWYEKGAAGGSDHAKQWVAQHPS